MRHIDRITEPVVKEIIVVFIIDILDTKRTQVVIIVIDLLVAEGTGDGRRDQIKFSLRQLQLRLSEVREDHLAVVFIVVDHRIARRCLLTKGILSLVAEVRKVNFRQRRELDVGVAVDGNTLGYILQRWQHSRKFTC